MNAPRTLWVTPESRESRLDWNGCLSFNTDNDGGEEYILKSVSDAIVEAAVVAAYEAAARVARRNTPAPAGGPFSHTNTARVVALDIEAGIHALIPADQHAAFLVDRAKLKLIKAAAQQSFAYARDARPAGYETAILKIEALLESALAEIEHA